jgi:hypothetical protein
MLYYATIRSTKTETRAIGLRRYAPGVQPVIRTDERFRMYRTTALDVARDLVAH